MIGDVLTHSEGAVGMHIISNDFGAVLSTQFVGKFLELGSIFGCPPVNHVTMVVEVASLVVKAVSHLVAYYHANCAIVAGIVGIGIEVWLLQDACREANLVG